MAIWLEFEHLSLDQFKLEEAASANCSASRDSSRRADFDFAEILLKLFVEGSAVLPVVDIAMTGWANRTYPGWMVRP
jgi:hypothetical protein